MFFIVQETKTEKEVNDEKNLATNKDILPICSVCKSGDKLSNHICIVCNRSVHVFDTYSKTFKSFKTHTVLK